MWVCWSGAGMIHKFLDWTWPSHRSRDLLWRNQRDMPKIAWAGAGTGKRWGSILLRDNTRLHVPQISMRNWYKPGVEVLQHSPYSSNLAPTDYHLFMCFLNFLAGRSFANQKHAKIAFLCTIEFIASWPPSFFRIVVPSAPDSRILVQFSFPGHWSLPSHGAVKLVLDL